MARLEVREQETEARLRRHAFAPPLNPTLVAIDWGKRGYSCGSFRDPPGRTWEDFVHSTNELVVVVNGQLELEVEGEIFDLSPGDEAFIPAGARHSVRNRTKSEVRWLFGYD